MNLRDKIIALCVNEGYTVSIDAGIVVAVKPDFSREKDLEVWDFTVPEQSKQNYGETSKSWRGRPM